MLRFKRGKDIMSLKTMKAEYIRATKDAQQMGKSNNYVVNVVANFKDKDGNDLEPEFGEVLLFGDAADKFGKPDSPTFIKKGQSLSVEGRYQRKKWTDKNGTPQSTEQILVSKTDMITLHKKKSTSDANTSSDTNASSSSSNFPDYDEESPFN